MKHPLAQNHFQRPTPMLETPPGPVAVSVSGSAFHDTPKTSTPSQPPAANFYPQQPLLSNPAVPTTPQRPSTAVAVDLREAAEMLNVSHQTIRREIDRGLIRALRIGRVWRIRVSEIEAYLERMENRGKRTLRF